MPVGRTKPSTRPNPAKQIVLGRNSVIESNLWLNTWAARLNKLQGLSELFPPGHTRNGRRNRSPKAPRLSAWSPHFHRSRDPMEAMVGEEGMWGPSLTLRPVAHLPWHHMELQCMVLQQERMWSAIQGMCENHSADSWATVFTAGTSCSGWP